MRQGPVTVRISEEDKKHLTEEAEKHGMSLAEILRAGAHLIAGFDEEFWKRLKNYSRNMNMTESFVIQNTVIGWMAQKAAEEEVYPKSTELLLEFAFSSAGPLPSYIQFENLKAMHVNNLERQKEMAIRILKDKGKASQKDLNWLKKREEKQAQLEREQEEHDRAVAEGRKGIIPGDQIQNIVEALKKRSSE